MGSINALIVGALLDIVDYLFIGMIPIAGDIIDLVGVAYFYKALGPAALAGLLEFVPTLDVLPTFTALGAYAYMRGGGK